MVEVKVGDEAMKERGVAIARVVLLTTFLQPVTCEFADGLQHREARTLGIRADAAHDQTLSHQGPQLVERVCQGKLAHSRGRLQCPAAGEDRETPENLLL